MGMNDHFFDEAQEEVLAALCAAHEPTDEQQLVDAILDGKCPSAALFYKLADAVYNEVSVRTAGRPPMERARALDFMKRFLLGSAIKVSLALLLTRSPVAVDTSDFGGTYVAVGSNAPASRDSASGMRLCHVAPMAAQERAEREAYANRIFAAVNSDGGAQKEARALARRQRGRGGAMSGVSARRLRA